MHPLNALVSLTSLTVLLVSLERFSFTTKVVLQPYDFLRLHEVVQIATLILATVLIPALMLRLATHNFSLLNTRRGVLLFLAFITGIYFYATGNGIHELASFQFNHYCDTQVITDGQCGNFFFNDYYTGNILYFLGAILMNVPLLIFERMKALSFTRRHVPVLLGNSLIYALAIFAYAAFDRVLVGLVYSLVMTGIALLFYATRRRDELSPITLYTAVSYSVGTLGSVLVRIF